MHQKTIAITGATSGIGPAAARALADAGHRVIVIGRDQSRTTSLAEQIGATPLIADFSRMDDVRRLAKTLRTEPLDVLANNVGGLFEDHVKTVDGIELGLQVNYLGSWLLTNLLLDHLRQRGATVINTSSLAHRLYARPDFTDLNYDRHFQINAAYGDTKLMMLMFTRELHRRYHSDGLNAVAFHPGIVASGFAKGANQTIMKYFQRQPVRRLITVSPEKGADTLVWLATSTPGVDWLPGRYYVRRRPARISRIAANDALCRQLWDDTSALLAARGLNPFPLPDHA